MLIIILAMHERSPNFSSSWYGRSDIWVFLNMLGRVYNIEIYMISYTLQKKHVPHIDIAITWGYMFILFLWTQVVSSWSNVPISPFYIRLHPFTIRYNMVGLCWFYMVLSQFISIYLKLYPPCSSSRTRCDQALKDAAARARGEAPAIPVKTQPGSKIGRQLTSLDWRGWFACTHVYPYVTRSPKIPPEEKSRKIDWWYLHLHIFIIY